MFDVAVWGTVGQWVSGTATSSAAIAAAFYYINDKRLSAREQANSIILEQDTSQSPIYTAITVRNLSDKPIFDVSAYSEHAKFSYLLKHRYLLGAGTLGITPSQLRELWKASKADASLLDWAAADATLLKPDETTSVRLDGIYRPTVRYWVAFADHRRRRWAIEYKTGELKSFRVKPMDLIVWSPDGEVPKKILMTNKAKDARYWSEAQLLRLFDRWR